MAPGVPAVPTSCGRRDRRALTGCEARERAAVERRAGEVVRVQVPRLPPEAGDRAVIDVEGVKAVPRRRGSAVAVHRICDGFQSMPSRVATSAVPAPASSVVAGMAVVLEMLRVDDRRGSYRLSANSVPAAFVYRRTRAKRHAGKSGAPDRGRRRRRALRAHPVNATISVSQRPSVESRRRGRAPAMIVVPYGDRPAIGKRRERERGVQRASGADEAPVVAALRVVDAGPRGCGGEQPRARRRQPCPRHRCGPCLGDRAVVKAPVPGTLLGFPSETARHDCGKKLVN